MKGYIKMFMFIEANRQAEIEKFMADHPELKLAKATASPKAAEAIIHESTATHPVATAFEVFNSMPQARRSDAIRAAEAAGVATYTARTQYQRWYKAQKAAGAK